MDAAHDDEAALVLWGDKGKEEAYASTGHAAQGSLLVAAGDAKEAPGDSLTHWLRLYWRVHVLGASPKTRRAKEQDLKRFWRFVIEHVGHAHIDAWTPTLTNAFQQDLRSPSTTKGGKALAPSSINRCFATLRHCAKWIRMRREFLAGDPFEGVRDIALDPPDWRGLSDRQIMRLRIAVDQRLKSCTRADQTPHLEAAVFYTLLHTGLRVGELVALNLDDYHHKGFHHVARKGRRVQTKVPVPAEAREHLDRYLDTCRGRDRGPLFYSRFGRRLREADVARICTRLAQQACTYLPEEEKFKLTPHKLRHSFLRRYADKHGVHAAQAASGNVSIREIFRYTRPSDEELEAHAEALYRS